MGTARGIKKSEIRKQQKRQGRDVGAFIAENNQYVFTYLSKCYTNAMEMKKKHNDFFQQKPFSHLLEDNKTIYSYRFIFLPNVIAYSTKIRM